MRPQQVMLDTMTYQVGFIVEQALGHITHGNNLKEILSEEVSIHAHWIFPAWETHGAAARIPGYRSNWTLRAGLRTRRALSTLKRRTTLDALFFHTQVTAVLAPDWLERIPSIVSVDATPLQMDALGEAYDHYTGPAWLENLKWQLNRRCFQKASRVVTWSEWARQGVIEGYGISGEKVHVVPPGVDLSQWQPKRTQISDEKVKILFVGGDLERKGGQLLVEAVRILQQELAQGGKHASAPAVELHLVTRTALPPEPGIIVHHGLQPNDPELKQLYAQADIFCLPSRADCLPMALSEAGAVGLPLVSTQMAAIPELVQDGESGLLIQPGDLGGLVRALRTLICSPDLRCSMGQEALRMVQTRYDARENAQAVVGLIREIVQERREARRTR
jgi:glycosyltransferase involved in cell wall biosynthesis